MSEEIVEISEQEVVDSIESQIDPDDRSLLSTAVREDLVDIIQGMIEKAKGVWVKETIVNKDGVEVTKPVYQTPPDVNVAQYLLNQLIGKPKETQVNLGIQNNIIIQWKK